jgi:hypothetical protein
LSIEDRVRLTAIAQALDPVQLLRQIAQLQDALWKHAVTQMPESVAASSKAAQDAMPTIRFSLDGASAPETRVESGSEGGRKYRRTKGLKGPRLYRTRLDPFAEVWHEVEAELTAHPERTAKAAFAHLQERYPGCSRRRNGECRSGGSARFWRSTTSGSGRVARTAVVSVTLASDCGATSRGRNGKISDEATAAAG